MQIVDKALLRVGIWQAFRLDLRKLKGRFCAARVHLLVTNHDRNMARGVVIAGSPCWWQGCWLMSDSAALEGNRLI